MLRYYLCQQKRLCSTLNIQPKLIENVRARELANQSFYSLHRPLLDFSHVGYNLIKDVEVEKTVEESVTQYMSTLKPFQAPPVERTTTLTIEVDPAYFNKVDDIADYLTAMQEKLDWMHKKKKLLSRKRKGFFEKN